MNLKTMVFPGILVFGSLAGALPAESQQSAKVHRIGYLAVNKGAREEAFREGLRALGYIEGKNLVIEWRFGRSDILELAAELGRAHVEVIVTRGTRATRAAQKVTTTIPIVMAGVGAAVSRGFVKSLSKPGSNITGLTTRSPDLADKRLELLKALLPNISRVGLLRNASRMGTVEHLRDAEISSQKIGLHLQSLELRGSGDVEKLFQSIKDGRTEGLIVVSNGLDPYRGRFIAFAKENRLPIIASSDAWPREGALMSYSPDRNDQQRHAAIYVDKILKGALPADLPVERARKFDLVVNLKTAQAFDLTIPRSIVYQADEVIR